jgi:hypothetical protein
MGWLDSSLPVAKLGQFNRVWQMFHFADFEDCFQVFVRDDIPNICVMFN